MWLFFSYSGSGSDSTESGDFTEPGVSDESEITGVPDDNSGWSDSDSDTLWGWLSGIISGLENIWEKITNIPSVITDWFATVYNTLFDKLRELGENIKSLPTTVLNGLKEIFIPDTADIEETFMKGVDAISAKFGFPEFDLDALADSSVQPDDVTSDYDIPGVGTMNLKFFDASFLVQGVEYFRPFIRGFIVLLLVFYNWRQFLSFIGHDIGAVAGLAGGSSKRGSKE